MEKWRNFPFENGSFSGSIEKKNLLSLGRGCSISDHPWEDRALLPSIRQALIPCPEAGGSLSLPTTAAGGTARLLVPPAVPPAWQQCHPRRASSCHSRHLQLINFPSLLFASLWLNPAGPGAGVATGDAGLVALAVALSLAGQRCRAAVYYSGQVQLQHRVCSAAPRRLLLPGACSFLPWHPRASRRDPQLLRDGSWEVTQVVAALGTPVPAPLPAGMFSSLVPLQGMNSRSEGQNLLESLGAPQSLALVWVDPSLCWWDGSGLGM